MVVCLNFSKYFLDVRSGSGTDLDTCSINSDTDPFYHSTIRESVDNLARDSCPAVSSTMNQTSIPGGELQGRRSSSTVPSPELKRPPGINKRLSVSTKSHLNRSDSSLSNPSPELLEGNVSPFEARTLPNVLRRISNLIAMGSHVGSIQVYSIFPV